MANTAKPKKLMNIFIPRLPNSTAQPPLEGSVNGKAFLLPRGQYVDVPPEVYEVVKRSLDNETVAEDYYRNVQKELMAKSKKEADDSI